MGHSFAMLESLAVLATILERFELRPASDSPDVELEAQVSLHPRGGLRLALEAVRA